MGLVVSICALAAVYWVLRRLSRIGTRESYLPPGPTTNPILGNLLAFPTSRAHIRFTEWAQEYGAIFSLKLVSNNVVVVSSAKLVRELDMKGATTSDRPAIHAAEIVYGDYELVFARHGTVWRKVRRVVQEILTAEKCSQHLEIQKAEASVLMYDMLQNPESWYTHTRRYSGSVILGVAFGIHCPTYENSYVSRVYQTLWDWQQLLRPGGIPPVDIFPFLKHIPSRWAPWKDLCRQIRNKQRDLFFSLLQVCEGRVSTGNRRDSFLEYVLDRQQEYGLDKEMIAYIGGTLLEAGTETTAVNLQSFILCMTARPEIQRRAQQEIDRVVGTTRTPDKKDLDDLPYIRALIKELHRYRPVGPTAVPHATTADERIGEYLLPKGTTIFVNLWHIFRDPELYDNPDEFNPDRFLNSEFGTKPGADTTGCREDMVFGIGRRICPGRFLASNAIAMNVLNILWAFNISPAKDSVTGQPIPVDINDSIDSILLAPLPFQCEIMPRDEARAEMIKSQYASAQSVFAGLQCD